MEMRRLWMISLFLLFIMTLGLASASGDFDDVVRYNQSDDQSIQSNDFNEDLSNDSDAGSSDNAGAGANDNVLSSENSDEVGAQEGNDVLGATLSYKSLYDSIYENGNNTPIVLTLENDYAYDESSDGNMEYGGISIYKNVTIHGDGHKIDGRGIFAHFVLTGTTSGLSSGNLIIDNLNLVNGKEADDRNCSGSILVTSGTSLTATNCRFESCSAKYGGAILASSGTSLSFTGCTFKDNVATATTGEYVGGGAIYGSSNSMTIANCTFRGNSAPKIGGAIVIAGARATIMGTTFLDNWIFGYESGDGDGGAIYAKNVADINVKNSNFRNNSAPVGAALYLYECGSVKIEDSAIEGNFALSNGVIHSAASGHFTFYNSTYADNRARDANMVILGNTIVNVTDSTFTGNGESAKGGAIYLNQGPSVLIAGSRFNNNNASYGGAIYASDSISSLSIRDSIFTGNHAPGGGAIKIEFSGAEIIRTNFTDNTGIAGAAIFLNQSCVLSIEDSIFNRNRVNVYPEGGYGSALFVDNLCNVNVIGSNFTGNVAANEGGAIIAFISHLNIIDSNFNDNEGTAGGAVYVTQSTLTVEGSNFTGNGASNQSGALYAIYSNIYVINSTFTQNHAQRFGGALYSNRNTVFKVLGSVFNGNYVLDEDAGYGGAISTLGDSSFNISHSTFNGNDARVLGGAIFAYGQNLFLSYDSFNANHAYRGGAIYIYDGSSQMDISKSNFTNQYTDDVGGAAIDTEKANLTVSNAIFYNNLAKGYGISVLANTGIIRDSILINTTIYGNIQQSNNQHLSPLVFTIDNIYDRVYGDSITLEITASNRFTGTVNVTVGSNTYPVEFNEGVGSTTITGLPVGAYKAIIDFHQTGTYYSVYTESNEFRVRYNTTFTIDVIPDVLLGETLVINVNEENGYTGNVRLDIGSNTYHVSMTNGRGTTSVDDLNVGSYNAIIEFQEDDEYASAYYRSNQFSVMYNTTFTIDAISDAIQGETIVVGVSEANGYTGDVNLVIGPKSCTISLSNGRGTKSINDLGVGSYKAVIDFTKSGNYASARSESNEFRVRYNTTFAFAPIRDVVLGEPIVINVTEANGYTGGVIVLIGSKYCTLILSNGKGNTSFDDLDVGSNSAVIDFTQSGDYASAYAESNLFKVRYAPEFVISQIPLSLYGDPIQFNITETHGMNATVNITVGFIQDSVELKNGSGSINISSIDVGVYTPVLEFTGSDTFAPAIVYGNEFTVKYPSFVDLKDVISQGGSVELGYDYGFDAAYDTQLSGGIPVTKDVVINANGHVIDAKGLTRIFDISNGVNVTITNATLRNGNAESGGAIRASSGTNVTVMNSTFENNTATVEGSAICSDGVVNVNASSFIDNPASEASGIHAESGEIVNSTIIGGSVSGNVHVSDCVFMSNPLFEIADIPDFVSGTSITIRVTESHGLTGKVEVSIGGETYLVDVENGVGVTTVTPGVSFGKYTAKLKFNQTSDYYSATAESNKFQVSINPEIQIADIADVEKGKTIEIKLTANRLFTGSVNVTIGGVNHVVDVTSGAGSKVITPNLKIGEYRATVTYSGNENYTAANVQGKAFKVYSSTQIVSNGVTAVYNGGQYLYVTLKDKDGNAVSGVSLTIQIGKAKTARAVTASNGQAKISINGISPGTYTAKITFAGNALYAKSTKSVKVTVKKATPKLTANKKTFKKSLKVKKYTVTLKDNRGKAMKNAKVILKIKKKTFTAKVNKNGKATFKITKFKKKGKFTATVTYKGSSLYNKLSKKVKITIR